MNARRSIRPTFATLLALVWCWSLLRVALQPGHAGPVEQGIAVGGWTLGVLPVHVAPWRPRRSRLRSGRLRAHPAHHGPTARPLPTPRLPVAPVPPVPAVRERLLAGATALSDRTESTRRDRADEVS